jgi:hypothetical protein
MLRGKFIAMAAYVKKLTNTPGRQGHWEKAKLWPLHTAACAEPLHFMLNGETRRAPGPPVTRAQMAWEDRNQVSFAVPRYSHRQAWARAA